MGEQTLADVAARLYALPFDDFIPARTAAAKESAAAAAGPSLAADVRSLPKPSVAAWTVNMLAVRQPETLRDVVELGRSMRSAQASLDAAELRRLGHERRQLLGAAVQAAATVAAEQGREISRTIATEVEGTLRAATADEGAAAAVQSGRLLRSLSADGVDVVDLSGAVAAPGPALPAATAPAPPPDASPQAEQPRLRAVRKEPRRVTPSALERARAALKDAEGAARAAEKESRQHADELTECTALTTELSETVRNLREQLVRYEQELKTARKRREVASARAQQAARSADKTRRAEDLARERVLRLGNTPG